MMGGSDFMRNQSMKRSSRKSILLVILIVVVIAVIILIWPLEKTVISVSNDVGHTMQSQMTVLYGAGEIM